MEYSCCNVLQFLIPGTDFQEWSKFLWLDDTRRDSQLFLELLSMYTSMVIMRWAGVLLSVWLEEVPGGSDCSPGVGIA